MSEAAQEAYIVHPLVNSPQEMGSRSFSQVYTERSDRHSGRQAWRHGDVQDAQSLDAREQGRLSRRVL